MLAEIADKMGTVHGTFLIALILAACTSFLGVLRWWLAVPSLLLAVFGNLVSFQEMTSPEIWDGIKHELGWPWIIGTFAAWNGAFGICWCGLACFHRFRRREKRRLEGFCGYDLTGNMTGVCPECGERT